MLLQARDVGAALVDEASERGGPAGRAACHIRKRFGGDFAIGRTIPYVLKNAPCEVWVVREPMPEEHRMKSRHRRLRARRARPSPRRSTRTGHEVVDPRHLDARVRPPAVDVQRAGIRGDGTDEDVLRRAGTEGADIFLALTEGDNRNVMAAQLAIETLGVGKVVAKINDPVRAAAYGELGIATVCRTNLMIDAMLSFLGFQPSAGPGHRAERSHRASARVGAARPGRRGCVRRRPDDARRRGPAGGTAARRRPERCSCSSSVAGRSATT